MWKWTTLKPGRCRERNDLISLANQLEMYFKFLPPAIISKIAVDSDQHIPVSLLSFSCLKMSGRQLPQNALKYSCNLPQDLRVTWSRTTSGKSSPLLYRKSNWNQSQSIPCSLDEGVRIIRNHSRVSPWPQYSLPIMGLPDNEVWHLPALCNILNGMTSRFVIFFF